jgi:PKD repeat protein
MKKAILFALALIAILITISLSYAGVSDVSIKKVYSSGQAIEGRFNVSLSNFPVDSMVSLSIEGMPVQQIPIKDFLEKNNISYTCSPSNCLAYFIPSNKESSKVVNGEKYIAITISDTADNVAINDLRFDMIGENIKPECSATPLTVDLLDDMAPDWKYLVEGNDFCGIPFASDSYSDSSADYRCTINPEPYCEKIRLPIASKFRLSADIKRGNVDVIMKISIGNKGFNEDSSCELDWPSLEPGASGILSCNATFMALDEKEYDICIKAEEYWISSDHDIKCETIDPYSGFTKTSGSVDFALYSQPADFTPFNDTEVFEQNAFYGPSSNLTQYIQNYVDTKYNKKCNSTAPCVIPIKVTSTQNINFSNADLSYYSGPLFHERKFSDAVKQPALISTTGRAKLENAIILDENVFKAPIKYGSYGYQLKIGTDLVDSGTIRVEKIPQIKITPNNFSAGVPVRFSLVTENATSYYWDFGDGSKTSTLVPYADHTYAKVGEYTLTVTLLISGMNITKQFTVYAMTPKDIVNSTIIQKSSNLAKMESDLNSLGWYKSLAAGQIDLSEMRKSISYYQTEAAKPDADFVALLNSLNNFIVFKGIKSENIGLAPVAQSVDVDLLSRAGAGNADNRANLEENIRNWQGYLDVKASGTVKIAEAEVPESNRDLLTVIDIEITPSKSLGKVFFIIRGMENAIFPNNDSSSIDGSRLFVFDSLADKKTIELALAGRINPADLEIISSPAFSEFVVGEVYCGNGICDKDKGEDYTSCPEDCKKPLITISKIIYVIIILIVVAGVLYWIWKYYRKMYEKKVEEKLFKNKADLYNLTFFIGKAMNKNEKEEDIRKKLLDAKWAPEQADYALQKIKRERRQVQLGTLKNFITMELRQNKIEEVIKNELKEAGWDVKDIDYAYKKTLNDIENEKKKMLKEAEKAKKAQLKAQSKIPKGL